MLVHVQHLVPVLISRIDPHLGPVQSQCDEHHQHTCGIGGVGNMRDLGDEEPGDAWPRHINMGYQTQRMETQQRVGSLSDVLGLVL
jgi:hypothetical protein